MKKYGALGLLLMMALYSITCAANSVSQDSLDKQAQKILQQMTLREKIGQKLMMDFRYWCETGAPIHDGCHQPFVKLNPTVKDIVTRFHLGAIILFSDNLENISQIKTLTQDFQQAMRTTNQLPLLIGADQEGGIVARMPRDVSAAFPGNMALAAAHLGHPDADYVTKVSRAMAQELLAVGINVDFAPDIDVNVNPDNPVINVRAFSDDPSLVAELGLQFSEGLQAEHVASTLKHFPGHGDTATDSHIGLPVVDHTWQEAWQIDLYPFQSIIKKSPPDLIMTAHIQFPALDHDKITSTKNGEKIITPATLSRKIQHDLLRTELGFQGVVITDALDMGAISRYFEPADAVLRAFQAGNDIALMPVSITGADGVHQLDGLISYIETAIAQHDLSESELNQSVLRIIKLKIKLGLLDQVLASPGKNNHAELERIVTNDAITLLQNNHQVIPVQLKQGMHIHILTPWLEQGAGIAMEIKSLQQQHLLPSQLVVSYQKISDTIFTEQQRAVDQADIIIVGNVTTKSLAMLAKNSFTRQADSLLYRGLLRGDDKRFVTMHALSPLSIENPASESSFAYEVLKDAKSKNKITIFISLLAPYDLPMYRHVADAMLAGYDFYGYFEEGGYGYYRGPSMQALTRAIFGVSAVRAKLPINIPHPDNHHEMIYHRGDGLTSPIIKNDSAYP